jgi:nucleoside-diphosphate-sugar epimerase
MRWLLTGSGGFLGTVIRDALREMETDTLGRGKGMSIRADISGAIPDLPVYDMVVHAAGKAHVVPKNAKEDAEFHAVNHRGTLNLLDALDRGGKPPLTFVLISTVAAYGVEEGTSIDESHPLQGVTPYAVSKKRAEEAVSEWAARNGVNALILRLPLVVGKNPPGNLGAMERHMRRGTYLRIGSGEARRSMVLATDVADLVERSMGMSGVFNLTDRHHPSIREIDSHMAKQLGTKIRSIPQWLAKTMARVGDRVPGSPFDSHRLEKLSRSLTFDDDRAVKALGWAPQRVLDTDFLI